MEIKIAQCLEATYLGFLLYIFILGAAFENSVNYNKSIQMLQYAIDEANEKILVDSGLKLAMEVEKLANGREFAISKSVCSLLEVMKSVNSRRKKFLTNSLNLF